MWVRLRVKGGIGVKVRASIRYERKKGKMNERKNKSGNSKEWLIILKRYQLIWLKLPPLLLYQSEK